MGRRFIAYLAAHRLVAFLAIFSLSFLIRFSLLERLPRSTVFHTGGETPRIARALVLKGQFADPYVIPTGPTAHTTPFYPVLVAGVYEVFGTGYWGNFVRCLLLVFSYSLLYALYPSLASAFGFPYAAGLIAGLASALVPFRRSTEVWLGWEEPYAAMALAFLLLLTLKRWKSPNRDAKGALFLGLCWGAALYISFTLVAILAGLLVFDLLANRQPRVVRDACLTMVAVVAVTAPWILRNHTQLHGWTLMRDNLGLELSFANHDHAAPSCTLLYRDPISWYRHPGNTFAVASELKSVGELEFNRRQLNMTLKWIAAHPASLTAILRTFFLFLVWTDRDSLRFPGHKFLHRAGVGWHGPDSETGGKYPVLAMVHYFRHLSAGVLFCPVHQSVSRADRLDDLAVGGPGDNGRRGEAVSGAESAR
jgi:hypothetical protein